ncbi:MAG: VWA-like domain-containing protein [Lachnospiraceae bacterium]|nr:VWA-like domain-containing protein [Lachnospiraceae bacterium]
MSDKKDILISEKAASLLKLSSDSVIVNMRFMDVALNRLKNSEKPGLQGTATDGDYFFYDSGYLLRAYLEDDVSVTRKLLHSLLHCIFDHPYYYKAGLISDPGQGPGQGGITVPEGGSDWDLACDIAVENIIMELEVPAFTLRDDSDRKQMLRGISKEVKSLTADKIYKYFLINPLARADRLNMIRLFAQDRHIYWHKIEDYEISEQAWKKISERIKTDLGTFSRASGRSESLIKNLVDTTKKKYDYKRLLEQFTVMGEELKVNDEEFDYIYYTYGLEHYGNMPLIEPLEFKDEKKVRDFAIVLDTSASCMGGTVKSFLKRTYDILKGTESFGNRINVHIIQCDSEVRSDTKITSDADFDDFIAHGKLAGYGGTDFRPAFEYLDELIEDEEFENFKGLIYFTDGYGIYPGKAPDYDCMFVFVKRDDVRPAVPWWGIRVELEEDELLTEGEQNEHSAG